MALLVWKGMRTSPVRMPFVVGLAAWILVLLWEVLTVVSWGRAEALGTLLEETLEYSGTLLIGLSATIAVHGHTVTGAILDLDPSGRVNRRCHSPWGPCRGIRV